MKARGFTALAVAVLGLGIGASTAVFSILSGTLLRPPPYREPQQLVDVLDASNREKRLSKLFSSVADFREYKQHSSLVDSLAAVTWAAPMPLMTGHGPARQVTAIPASERFFDVLGTPPAMGRGFTAEDVKGGCTVVLSHSFWRGVLGGDPRVVGQSLTLDDRPCRVIGVM